MECFLAPAVNFGGIVTNPLPLDVDADSGFKKLARLPYPRSQLNVFLSVNSQHVPQAPQPALGAIIPHPGQLGYGNYNTVGRSAPSQSGSAFRSDMGHYIRSHNPLRYLHRVVETLL